MNFDLEFYWGLFLRRLPVMTALFLVCAVSASVTALKLPPTYSTSAQLLVEDAQIPDSMVGQCAADGCRPAAAGDRAAAADPRQHARHCT